MFFRSRQCTPTCPPHRYEILSAIEPAPSDEVLTSLLTKLIRIECAEGLTGSRQVRDFQVRDNPCESERGMPDQEFEPGFRCGPCEKGFKLHYLLEHTGHVHLTS